MTFPPSAMFVTTYLPWARRAQVSDNLTCAGFCAAPCARSIPFPTATIIQCKVGSSHPAYILWKNMVAARYPLTVDCRLLCT